MLGRNLLLLLVKIPSRPLSSGQKLINLKLDDEGIALMTWNRPKVNSLNSEIFQEIGDSVLELGENENCKGLIMTSGIPKIFSAGLDLNELSKPDKETLSKFAKSLQHALFQIHNSEVITAVAINGFTAAGACILSLMSDYRVMVDGFRIAMNDTAVGIVPSWWVCQVMNRTMGHRQAEIAITSSRMYTAGEALKVQMIDEVAADTDDAIEKCKLFIRQYENVPRKIHSAAKRKLREPVLKHLEQNIEDNDLINNILNPYTQELIGKYVDLMRQKKK